MCTSPGAPYTMVDGSWISKVVDCVQGVVMGLGFAFRVLGDGGWCSSVWALKVPRERQASSLACEQLCLLPFFLLKNISPSAYSKSKKKRILLGSTTKKKLYSEGLGISPLLGRSIVVLEFLWTFGVRRGPKSKDLNFNISSLTPMP